MVQGLQIEDSELREFTHGMLGSIADKLGKDFAPFLPHAVEAAFASCSQASTHCLYRVLAPGFKTGQNVGVYFLVLQ